MHRCCRRVAAWRSCKLTAASSDTAPAALFHPIAAAVTADRKQLLVATSDRSLTVWTITPKSGIKELFITFVDETCTVDVVVRAAR